MDGIAVCGSAMMRTMAPQTFARGAAVRWAALALVTLILAGAGGAARAEDSPSPEPTTARWGIAPGPSETEGERSEFAFTLNPGESLVDRVAITNLSPVDLTFDIYSADGIITDDGDPAILDQFSPVVDLGAWIGFNQIEVTVPAESSIGLPFRVTVPSDALPGEHCGGLVASLQRADAAPADATSLVVDARTAVWTCVTVPGEVAAALDLDAVGVRYRPGRGGFGGGTVEVTGEVVNTGNLRLASVARLRVKSPWGWWERTGADVSLAEVLPGQSLPFSVTLDGVPPWARLGVELTLAPVARPDLPRAPDQWVTRSVWAAPWIAALGALALAGLGYWLATIRRRHRRRIDRAVAAALAARAAEDSGE
jgi:hypothetical protein